VRSFNTKGTAIQTSEAALVEMVELNDEDLLVVSGGLGFTIHGPTTGAVVGAGGTAISTNTSGTSTGSGSTVNSSFTGGDITVTF